MFCPNCGTLVEDKNSCPKCSKPEPAVDARQQAAISDMKPQSVHEPPKEEPSLLDRWMEPKIRGDESFEELRKRYNMLWVFHVAAIPIYYFCTELMRVDGKQRAYVPIEILYALAVVGVLFFAAGLYIMLVQLKQEKIVKHKEKGLAAAYVKTVSIVGMSLINGIAILGVIDSELYADDHYKFYFFGAGLAGLVICRFLIEPKWRFIEGFSQVE